MTAPYGEATTTSTGVLECPSCEAGALLRDEPALVCDRCGVRLAGRDGVFDLTGADGADTDLDVEDYTATHYADDDSYRNAYAGLAAVFEAAGLSPRFKTVLEIGAGSGAWTVGLSRDGNIGQLYASDISPGFMKALSRNVDPEKAVLLRAGAEDLRVRPDSLDLVLGRSILHHLLDYEEVLRRCHRWLRPGGAAIFFEPCIEGKAWMAFLFDVARRLDNRLGLDLLDDEQKRRLERGTRNMLKEFYLDDIDRIRPQIEDKYVFDTADLERRAARLGYDIVYTGRPGYTAEDFARSLRHKLAVTLKDPKAVGSYMIVVESLLETVGRAFPGHFQPPMKYFVLRKRAGA